MVLTVEFTNNQEKQIVITFEIQSLCCFSIMVEIIQTHRRDVRLHTVAFKYGITIVHISSPSLRGNFNTKVLDRKTDRARGGRYVPVRTVIALFPHILSPCSQPKHSHTVPAKDLTGHGD